jgi:3',5'-cyclic AMP phosphodiesterase CpdA
MRIFAVSDLHTDFAENRRRLQLISSTSYLRDALVVAGDMRIIDWTLRELRSRFGQVFYAPGNHELWVRDGEYDSVENSGEFFACAAR